MTDYDLAAMKAAILNCDNNVKIFEAAIAKEMVTKMEYQRIVRFLKEQEANKPVVEVVVEKE